MNCYVYKWTHTPTMNWYVGSRTSRNARIDDGYICSSRTVRSLIQSNLDQWSRTIVATGTAEEMYALETEILQLVDARADQRSYNRHNNDGIAQPGWNRGLPMSEETKEIQRSQRLGKSTAKKGRTYPGSHSEEARKKKSLAMLGNTRSQGKPWSEARRQAHLNKAVKNSQLLNIQGE